MQTFIIEETVPCFVTWRCEIEAKDEAEAREIFAEGGRGTGETGPFIGDALGNYDPVLTIEPAPPAGKETA